MLYIKKTAAVNWMLTISEMLQHVMQPNGPSPVLPHLSYKPINQGFEKETLGARQAMVQRPITSDFSAINGG